MRCLVGDFKLGEKEKQAIIEVINSGRLSEGSRVHAFERKWAKFIGTKHCIATSSGSGALITGLTAIKYLKNLPSGTEVITSPLTYIATSSAISAVGFEPVYVDVDPTTFNITPENILNYLRTHKQNNCKIVLPVHLMGYPTEMDEINQLAKEYQLVSFEDAAQAHGTTYQGKRTGALSDLADFSFYIAHNIQAGEMGAITTNDEQINRLARKIKAQGRECDCAVCTRSSGYCRLIDNKSSSADYDPRFSHDLIGYNFKTMEFQAALALTQIDRADWILKRRQENVKYLNEALDGLQDIFQLPKYGSNISYLAYPLVIKKPNLISRAEVRSFLQSKGIETRPLFGCIPTQQPAYEKLRFKYKGKLPVAEYLGRNGFYLGCHQYLSREDLKYIAGALIEIGEECKRKTALYLSQKPHYPAQAVG